MIGLPYCYSKVNLIQQGEIGLARNIDGTVRILEQGWHFPECVLADVERFQVTNNRIIHGPMHLIRVLPGDYGLCRHKGLPVILEPGLHVVNDPLFEYVDNKSMTDPLVTIGTSYIITVVRDKIGLVTVNGEPFFLEPGRHFLNNPRLKFEGFRSSTDEHIGHGARNRVLVPSGRIGLAWDRGQPLVLESGRVYNFLSPTFRYDGSRDIADEVIVHGSIRMVTVKDGKFGISYDDGVLKILNPGRHVWDKPSHMFASLMSAGQTTLSIKKVTGMSSDNVGLEFDAAITVQVTDAKKAVTMLAGEGVEFDDDDGAPRVGQKRTVIPTGSQYRGVTETMYENIKDKARLALSIIIGNNHLNRTFVATSKSAPASEEAKEVGQHQEEENSASSFKQHVHDVFMRDFSLQMVDVCGVKVIDMSVEDVRIINPELAAAMAKGAVARTDLEKAKIEGSIRDAQAAAEQRAAVTHAEGQARAMSILAQAESERIRALDQAMSTVCAVTQQRELIRAAGEVIASSKSTLLFGNNIADMSQILGGGNSVARR